MNSCFTDSRVKRRQFLSVLAAVAVSVCLAAVVCAARSRARR